MATDTKLIAVAAAAAATGVIAGYYLNDWRTKRTLAKNLVDAVDHAADVPPPSSVAVIAHRHVSPAASPTATPKATHRGGPVIVGVGGASGSGKTSIAELIGARLSDEIVVSIVRPYSGLCNVSIMYPFVSSLQSSDNYYLSLPPGTNPAHYNFDHPQSIDFELMASHVCASSLPLELSQLQPLQLEKLRKGQDVEVPNYDFVHHR
jgi:hypothetical protein